MPSGARRWTAGAPVPAGMDRRVARSRCDACAGDAAQSALLEGIIPMSGNRLPIELTREVHGRALRHSEWIAFFDAGELHLADIERQLDTVVIEVDQRREEIEDEARPIC
jgi:hypothetical protein